MGKIKHKEIKRIRHILDEIVSLAEDDELQGGTVNAVKRYNAIVRHLESLGAVPAGLFQALSEDDRAVSFHQVAVESRMLSGYLEESDEEEEEEARGKPDFSPVIALAPFLDQVDLKNLIHSHLSGHGFAEREAEEEPASGQSGPTLKALVKLAPHMNSKDLAEMVEACLARDPAVDLNLFVALAPHMKSEDLGRVLRQHVPSWFAAKGQEEPVQRPDPNPVVSWQGASSVPETYER